MKVPDSNHDGATDSEEDPLKTLLPGDAVEIWADGTFVVKTVFLCREVVDGRSYEWRWMFLDDGSLIEVSLDGYFRYRDHRILKQGTGLYEELVAQDGALVRFEERVREGSSGRRPVHVSIDEKQYTISATGTLLAERLGDPPDLMPWGTIGNIADDNVYFSMYEDEQDENVVLGLWTTHVCLSFGKAFDPSDVTEIYRRGNGKK
jgi:hypothetical protein